MELWAENWCVCSHPGPPPQYHWLPRKAHLRVSFQWSLCFWAESRVSVTMRDLQMMREIWIMPSWDINSQHSPKGDWCCVLVETGACGAAGPGWVPAAVCRLGSGSFWRRCRGGLFRTLCFWKDLFQVASPQAEIWPGELFGSWQRLVPGFYWVIFFFF